MYPRLIIVSVVGLAALSGCKHRDSLTEFNGPTASVQPVAVAETHARTGPLERLGNAIFGSRGSVAHADGEDVVIDDEDPIQYVDPVTPPYGASRTVETSSLSTKDVGYADEIETLPAYTLDSGDRIRVFVFDQPNLSRVYNVDGQGRISMPLIGSVLARGHTTRKLESAIKYGLQRKFVKDAKVSIEVAVYRPFYIHGEVRTPGQFPYVYGMTVEAAIATAGGFSPRARKNGIRIVRTVDGSREVVVSDPSAYVRPGDIITVDERFF